MMRIRTFAVVILLAVLPLSFLHDQVIVASPVSLRQHPRLLVTADSLPALKARLGTGGTKAADFRAWLAWLDSRYSAAESSHDMAMNFAFAWLTYPVTGASYGYSRAEYGARARSVLMSRIAACSHDKTWGVPLAYDWLGASGLLSAADKTQALACFRGIDAADGAATTADNTPINNVFNSFAAIGRSQKMLYALAIAGDGIDDGWANGVIDAFVRYFRDDRATTNLQRGVTWAQSSYGGDDGGFPQGIDYGYGYTAPPLILAEESYRTAMGISKAVHYGTPDTNLFRYLPKFTAWSIINDAFPRTRDESLPDGYWWLFVKNHKQYYSEVPAPGDYPVRATLAAVRGMFDSVDPAMAGLAKWLMTHRTGDLSPQPDGNAQRSYMVPYSFLIESEATSPETSPADLGLPISQEHDRGWWTFRTSWNTNIDEPYVMLAAQRRFANLHSMTSNGDFQIYRKGPVVLRQGIGVHSYTGRSDAGAMMVFPDRSLGISALDAGSNLGASRWFFNPTNNLGADWAPGSPGDTGGESRFLAANAGHSDINYVYVDLTKAYDHTIDGHTVSDRQGPRLSSYVRQFVYFLPRNPTSDSVRVVVFDRISTLNTKFEKNWRLPLAGEPIFVNGAVSPGPSRGPDGTARKTHSTNTTLVTATNTMHGANSKLWLTPLLPSARDVIKIGQAVVTGQVPLWEDMYGRVTEDGQAPERHQANSAPWRIEVVSATGSLTDSFLNVIEVTDNGGGQSPTETIRGQRFVGARVGDRIAVFAEQSNRETTGSFTVPTAGSYRILVGGLVPGGEYNVTYGGFSARETAPASGTVVLDATVVANTTFTLQATGAVATLPPAAPQNVRVIGGP